METKVESWILETVEMRWGAGQMVQRAEGAGSGGVSEGLRSGRTTPGLSDSGFGCGPLGPLAQHPLVIRLSSASAVLLRWRRNQDGRWSLMRPLLEQGSQGHHGHQGAGRGRRACVLMRLIALP